MWLVAAGCGPKRRQVSTRLLGWVVGMIVVGGCGLRTITMALQPCRLVVICRSMVMVRLVVVCRSVVFLVVVPPQFLVCVA